MRITLPRRESVRENARGREKRSARALAPHSGAPADRGIAVGPGSIQRESGHAWAMRERKERETRENKVHLPTLCQGCVIDREPIAMGTRWARAIGSPSRACANITTRPSPLDKLADSCHSSLRRGVVLAIKVAGVDGACARSQRGVTGVGARRNF